VGNKGTIGAKARSSIQNKVTSQVTKVKYGIKVLISDKGPLENKGFIGANRPSISTDEGKMSGDKCSTGNNGSIGDNESSINTEQGKI
jgi:hypothetical protein